MKPVLAWLTATLLCCTASAQPLPDEVQHALRSTRLPPEALALWVAPLDPASRPRLAWRERQAHNPASLAKLVTTWAALEQLGPAWRWRTPVWIKGRVDPTAGTLHGDVVLAGRGDPTLVIERLWLLLRRLQQLGVRDIQGDFVLDTSAFAPDTQSPAEFDGEPWRPGNVRPDALLFNFKSWTLQIQPDAARGVAWISTDVPMPLSQDRVPLKEGACVDARAALRANWVVAVPKPSEPAPLRVDGHWPTACSDHRWPLADPDPASYNARFLAALWREMGGAVKGLVRSGVAPKGEAPAFEWMSLPLADVVRDINKHSNNLMAEQLGLTLALQSGVEPATADAARTGVQRWLLQRMGWAPESFVWDRASGLSRHTRLTAQQIGQVLQAAWASPVMPEFVASLALAGQDGTLVRDPARFGPALARAHLKTGSLRDVNALAGYLMGRSGQRYAVVALLQHPLAAQGRPVLDAVVRWVAADAP